MNDAYVSRLAVMVVTAWAVVAAVMGLGWAVIVLAPNDWLLGLMLAETGCVLSAGAAVFSIRRYAVRICRLVRNVNSSEGSDSGLRSIT